MSLKIQALKNVTVSWLGLLTSMVVGFLLSPFILHKLGDEAFGIWILIFSVTGYYGLLDFGIRSSIIRYVSKFAAVDDREQLTRFINTSLFSYGVIALLLLVVTGAGWFYLGAIFRISPDFLGTARILLLIVGTGVAVSFPLGVFAGVLEGLQKFTWLSFIQVAYNVLRALLIVIVLERGFGLIAIAAITTILSLLSYVAYVFVVFRLVPVRLGRGFVDPQTLHQIIAYGAVTFVMAIGEMLRFRSDVTVIGIFLTSQAITYYSIGSKLADYPTSIVQTMAQVFTPMSSHFEATGDIERLRKVFVGGNRACAFTILPLAAVLIVLGKSVIEVWVGAKYLSSYSILLFLIVAKTLYLAQATSTKILFGMSRHRILALVLLLEGLSNLVLSILLLRHFGIVGVALGTAIPLAFTSLFFLPRHLCRLLGIPIGTFLRQAYLQPLGLSVLLVVTLLFVKQIYQAHSYVGLFLQVACAGVIYGVGLLWLFVGRELRGLDWRSRFVRLLQHPFSW